MGVLDQIILSCNEDTLYSEFWPTIAWAYKKIFPEVTVHLAFLTNRSEDDALVKHYREFGKVTLFKPLSDIPEFGQAKMLRFILASQQGEDVCYIDDIDLFPLSKSFIMDKVSKRPKNVLLCVGGEVYGFNGCYPISQMTGEGNLWKQFINPHDYDYRQCLRQWKDQAFYDHRENIMIKTDFANDMYFSDERLLKRILVENPVPKLELKRGYDNYLDSTIDRHTYVQVLDEWQYDRERLKYHGYVNAHGVRPFKQHEKHYAPLIQYINDNY